MKKTKILSGSSSISHSRRISTASTLEIPLTNLDFNSPCDDRSPLVSPKCYKQSNQSSLYSNCEASLSLIELNQPEISKAENELMRLKEKKNWITNNHVDEIKIVEKEFNQTQAIFDSYVEKHDLQTFLNIYKEDIKGLEDDITRVSKEHVDAYNITDSDMDRLNKNSLKKLILALNSELKEKTETIEALKFIERKSDMSNRCLTALSNKVIAIEEEVYEIENSMRNFQRKISDLNIKMVEIEDNNKSLMEKIRATDIKNEKLKKNI